MSVPSEHQALAPSSAFTPVDPNQRNPVISSEKLLQLYAAMLRLRSCGNHSARTSPRRRAKPDGQEASIVGCTLDLRPSDTIVALRNQNLEVIWNTATPAANRANGDVVRAVKESAILVKLDNSAARVAWATGIALQHRLQNKGNIAVAFAQLEEIGASRESLHFAHERCLPIIFVEVKLESRSNSRTRPRRSAAQIPAIPVDQSDVVAVYRVASEAIDKARRGAGPMLIQCVSYRQRGARPSGDGHSSDPILYMQHYLRKKNLWSGELEQNPSRDRRSKNR
ncbi:MAG TPA: thiamine pyrophosphate-dependent enzyme [Terriglobales bacterium]|nr:thiamine pyrophosphate-dependent enzyme [Terriglobales bacterium]